MSDVKVVLHPPYLIKKGELLYIDGEYQGYKWITDWHYPPDERQEMKETLDAGRETRKSS